MAGHVVDFAGLRAGLAIEIGGEHHGIGRRQGYDAARDIVLARLGLRVLRISNHEVTAVIDVVVEAIPAEARRGLDDARAFAGQTVAARP